MDTGSVEELRIASELEMDARMHRRQAYLLELEAKKKVKNLLATAWFVVKTRTVLIVAGLAVIVGFLVGLRLSEVFESDMSVQSHEDGNGLGYGTVLKQLDWKGGVPWVVTKMDRIISNRIYSHRLENNLTFAFTDPSYGGALLFIPEMGFFVCIPQNGIGRGQVLLVGDFGGTEEVKSEVMYVQVFVSQFDHAQMSRLARRYAATVGYIPYGFVPPSVVVDLDSLGGVLKGLDNTGVLDSIANDSSYDR